jgi:hypothetical protein
MKKPITLFLSVLLAMTGFVAWAGDDLEIVTGEHWTDSSMEQRRAYLFGVGNMLEIEQAMAGDTYQSMRGRSVVPVLLEGLSGVSISDIVVQLDKFYADHPDQLNRPVIEVLYLEMALPNLHH